MERNSFDDFNDVFGGPPRRFSIHETRFSLSEAVDPGNDQWSELGQKPVFGEENLNRRRYQSDFFDDIFRVDESCSSPRAPFGSNPGSRVLSPARPLLPKAEPFGTSLPANFSLPSKLIKAVDFPLFASSNYSPYRMNDSIANGMSHQCTKNAFLSRFSSGVLEHDELKDDIRLSNCQSPLPKELPLNIDESQNTSKFKETDMGSGLNEAPKVVEAQSNTTRFHFSIYKWAGRGMPLLTPLRGGSISKLKEKSKPERCSTSNGRIESADVARKLLKPNQPESVDSTFLNHSISKKTRSLTLEGRTNGKENTQDGVEPQQVVDEADLDMLESKSLESMEFTVESVPVIATTSEKREDKKQSSLREEEREILTNKQETHKLELKPLRSLLNDEIEGEDCTGNIKNSIIQEASKASRQGPHTDSGDNLISYKVKGKVKEFVKLFNQEDSLDQQINADTQSRSSRLKSTIVYEANKGPRITTIRMSQKKPLPSMNKMPDFSGMVDESIEKLKSVHQNSQMKTSICKTSNSSIVQKDSEPIHDSLPNSPSVIPGGIDGNLQGNIVIEELSHEQEKNLQAGEDFEDFQVADIKIRQWSNGKKGNIRSLLSTLQFVLWPESGWKPVPLVDIIEGTAVKRAYQKALLCLHPDKLQQKGAASYKKHIAEKVFDILQEAWDHFNSLGSL